MATEKIETIAKIPEHAISALNGLITATFQLAINVINLNADVVAALCSIPGKIIGATMGSYFVGLADPAVHFIERNVGMKSALHTLIQQGQALMNAGPTGAIKAGAEEMSKLAANIIKPR